MLNPKYLTKFEKDYKRCQKRGYKMQDILEIMEKLEKEIPLEAKHQVHQLQGEYKGKIDCHINSDWILIYEIDKKTREIFYVRTGTHSDLF